ncbi:hypothetical protein SAMN02745824_3396 [Parasphingorhabdus marina DSM 22363]|uniref:Uncharacterized protein n=1 Tax=Parasphingorhabdus marina DSM 22363 TaxID=1123272 RepID=A0A1N6HPZ5_9SPHN|nr:hypothetical protein [Parasphingorhabdus marina]SIO21735.1 hypothetical protein SAMN02745824_3396 [Parasphingorhabdus marina DSM 22363]
MRQIEVDTDVFASIWAHRAEGEESENDILRRLLVPSAPGEEEFARWRDDVRSAFRCLDGAVELKKIYKKVRDIRAKNGRSLPRNTEAIIRREIEQNSSDSDAYLGHRDWFKSVGGIGSGLWTIRN